MMRLLPACSMGLVLLTGGACAASTPERTDAGPTDAFQPGDLALTDLLAEPELPAPDLPTPDLGPVSLELGLGLVEHVPVEDGAAAELVRGVGSGTMHISPSVRAFGLAAEGFTLTLVARDPVSGERLTQLAHRELSARNTLATENGFLRVGNLLVFEDRCAERLVGRRIRLLAAVGRLGDEPLAEAEVELTLVDEVYPDDLCPEP